jgi:dTDP-4-dehydrorhamnose reductase
MVAMRKILIFGAGGFTGGRLAQAALSAGWQVIPASHRPAEDIRGTQNMPIDIAESEDVDRLVRAVRPDVVINPAAIAGIDYAQQHPAETYRVNVTGAANIARACVELGCRHIFLSSDAVFDGTAAQYTEDAPVNPLNYYGYTKATAEKQIMEICPSAIIRVALILGFPIRRGNSTLANLKTQLKAGQEVFAPEDEFRTPVDIHTLCAAVLELAGNRYTGLLHIAALEGISRYALNCRLAARLGFDPRLIRPAGLPPDRAPRHKNGLLCVRRAQNLLKTPLLSLDQTIEQALIG